MAATIRINKEPAKMVTVKKVVTVKAEVDTLLPAKYLETSYQSPEPLRFTR